MRENTEGARAPKRERQAGAHLRRGRASYDAHAWADAYRALSDADRAGTLLPQDLERLATSAYLIGRRDDFFVTLDRAHHAWLESGSPQRAARCAFWVGLHLLLNGEDGPATGWLARARRLLEQAGHEAVEQGYLLVVPAERQIRSADYEGASSTARAAIEIGERFHDSDLVTIARHQQGRALVRAGQIEAGLALLDETMVAVTAAELSPIVNGLIYCSVIGACQEVYALDRATAWTTAMARWCGDQPQLVAFTGICLVHRSEILQIKGAWPDALAEARRACQPYSEGLDARPPAAAFYQQAEVHRLRGEFAAAEAAYRSASQWGCEPQPGLALLRLSQGRHDAAAAAIRRALGNTRARLDRARLLPACVEILVATADLDGARVASAELQEIAGSTDADVLRAMAAHARGAVVLAEGDPRAALESLQTAWQAWLRVDAPYQTARARELLGLACRALGDHDGARLEFDAAREEFARLGAGPDLARLASLAADVEDLAAPVRSARPHGLTPREIEVLRLVAAGKTNKMIARQLSVSEKTVDRHVSNIFSKLDVPTRAAATAFAYEHQLVQSALPGRPRRT